MPGRRGPARGPRGPGCLGRRNSAASHDLAGVGVVGRGSGRQASLPCAIIPEEPPTRLVAAQKIAAKRAYLRLTSGPRRARRGAVRRSAPARPGWPRADARRRPLRRPSRPTGPASRRCRSRPSGFAVRRGDRPAGAAAALPPSAASHRRPEAALRAEGRARHDEAQALDGTAGLEFGHAREELRRQVGELVGPDRRGTLHGEEAAREAARARVGGDGSPAARAHSPYARAPSLVSSFERVGADDARRGGGARSSGHPTTCRRAGTREAALERQLDDASRHRARRR